MYSLLRGCDTDSGEVQLKSQPSMAVKKVFNWLCFCSVAWKQLSCAPWHGNIIHLTQCSLNFIPPGPLWPLLNWQNSTVWDCGLVWGRERRGTQNDLLFVFELSASLALMTSDSFCLPDLHLAQFPVHGLWSVSVCWVFTCAHTPSADFCWESDSGQHLGPGDIMVDKRDLSSPSWGLHSNRQVHWQL